MASKKPAKHVTIDISAAAAALGVSPTKLLEEMEVICGGWRLNTAVNACKRALKEGTPHSGDAANFRYLVAHFVRRT